MIDLSHGAKYAIQRREMLQFWADYVEELANRKRR